MQKKNLFITILVFIVCVLTIGLVLGVRNYEEKSTIISKTGTPKSDLAVNLAERTNLGYNNMPESRKINVTKVYDSMQKDSFFGMYMGIKNNQLIFSGSNGYSNASTGKKFNVSSMFNGGKYQDYLNDAILIRLIEKGKIKETEQLSRYIPTLKDYGDISVRQFLVNGSGLYVSKNRIKSDSGMALDNTAYKKSTAKNLVSADASIKVQLIASVTQTSYRSAFKKLVIDHFGLMNTEVRNSTNQQESPDVVGYKYHKKNGLPDQSKREKQPVVLQGVNQLKISVPDMLVTYQAISSQKYFSKKYNNLWREALRNSNLAMITTGNSREIKIMEGKQQIVIRSNFKKNTIIAVAENFPNTKMTTVSLLKRLSQILD